MAGRHFARGFLTLAVTLVCVSQAAGQDAPGGGSTRPGGQGAVEGYITGRFEGQVRVLPFALVEATGSGARRSLLAEGDGAYRLEGLPPGDTRLIVSQAGYEPLTVVVSVPAGGSVRLDLELSGAPVPLPSVDVLTGTDLADSRISAPALDERAYRNVTELELEALEFGPGIGLGGLVDVVSALPGNDPADATDVLFLRGSTTDLRLVLLDGVPVYTPFHVAGLMKSFEPELLGAADLHVGGAPARFDGGLTHILDLRTRTPRRDRTRFAASADLISSSAAIEAPLGRGAGIIASGRALHGLGETTLGAREPYGYRDGLVTVSAEPARGQEIRATGFWNTESVALDAQGAPEEAWWANRAGSLRYSAGLGSARTEITAGVSRYRAELPLRPSQLPDQPPPAEQLAGTETDRVRLLGEVSWGAPGSPVRVGLSLDDVGVLLFAQELDGSSRAESRGATLSLGAFVDATRPVAPGLTLRAGLRADRFGGASPRLAPRAALAWELSPEALLTIAAGRYHQATRTPQVEAERALAEVSAEGEPPQELLPVATADHVVLSLDQRLGERVRLGLQGFWKGFEGLPSAVGETVRSSGVDLRVLSAGERGAIWLGYGLSWFWSTIDLSGSAADFTGRHLLSAGVSGSLGGRLEGEARIAYGAGLPYTSLPFGSGEATFADGTPSAASGSGGSERSPAAPLAEGLDGDFLRVDLELHARFEPSWGGHPWQVRPYVRLLNALDRRDALFYTFQPWRAEAVRPLAERSVLPLVGLSVSF